MHRMGSPGTLLFLLVICLCLGMSCGTEQSRFNLVLIGVDTLRRDHLGCYGYNRATSPNIDLLASEGVLFEEVVSQSPWTLPSFATVFTSLYPTQHGAGTFSSGSAHFGNSMRTSFPPLAMMLLKNGYSTGAIINGPALAPEYGVDRGFESYNGRPNWDSRPADRVTADALEWIDEHKGDPFFIFVHYFDPHVPYAPPPPYDRLFDPGYNGRVGRSFDRATYSYARQALSIEGDPRAESDWNHIRALYDGEIKFTDDAVGRLLDGLKDRALRKNTLIVFLSDHGEEFFDHGGFEHGHTLFDELIKVPLVFSLPGVIPANVRVDDQVRLLDVLPTILDLMGIDPESHLEGSSLKPLMAGDGDTDGSETGLLSRRFAYSESILYGTEKKSIVAYPWKLIYDTVTGERMLYDLAHDPGEHNNAIEYRPETRNMLEEVLFKTLCGISETWYIELAANTNTIDIALTLPARPIPSEFTVCKFFDSDGHLLDSGGFKLDHVKARTGHTLRLDGLRLSGELTLAVKIAPKTAPLEFDLRVDGERAAGRTFLGKDLKSPDDIPFTQNDTFWEISKGEPRKRPKPPYVLVWHSGTESDFDTPVSLAEDTKRKLKALGYIQ
jgi:arylsulfatase A-like enzyme